MAIQQRRGADADFDSTKMLPGELAVTTDGTRKVYVAFAPGDTKELASAEEVQEIVDGFNENVEENIQKAADEIEQKKEEALAEIPNYEAKLAELETYKANSILSKSTGEVVTTTDSAKAKPKNIRLYGKTEQDSTEGNQLFSGVIEDITYRDGAFVSSTLKSAIVPIQGGETYTISITTADTIFTSTTSDYPSVGVATVDAYAGSGGIKVNKKTLSTNANTNYLVIGFGSGVDAHIGEIMVNKGNTALPLEEYTGGQASPNMNYQQPLNSHGDSGSIVGKVLTRNVFHFTEIFDAYEEAGVSIETESLNSFSYSGTLTDSCWIKTGYANRIGQRFYLPHGDYIVTFKDSGNHFNCNINGSFDNDTTNECSYVVLTKSGTYAFNVQKGYENLFFNIFSNKNSGNISGIVEIQIERDNTAHEIEPYTEQPFTALTPNGLPGIPLRQTIPDVIKNSPIHMAGVYWDNTTSQHYIGDTKDYENGEYVQRILEQTFDGSDDEGWGVETNTPVGNRYFVTFNKKALVSDTRNGVTSMNTSSQIGYAGDTYVLPNLYVIASDGRLFISLNGTETLEEFKTILAEKPMTVLCVLADPIIIDLTQEELDQYNALLMNYPNTTVVNDAGAYMEVEYVCDTQKHIEQNYISKAMYEEHENRIAELEKAIVNS